MSAVCLNISLKPLLKAQNRPVNSHFGNSSQMTSYSLSTFTIFCWFHMQWNITTSTTSYA